MSTLRILLVDDQPLIRDTLRPMLEAFGYDVVEAGSGEDALAVCDDVAMLVTDICMPGMDGHELARRFEARRPGVPVLFISGYADERPALGPRRRFLAKPFTMEALIGAVDTLVDRRPPRFV